MNKNKLDNFIEIKGSNNLFLNKIGNICGWIGYRLQGIQMRWGTMYEWDFNDLDLEEDINKPEYNTDEIW